MRHLYRARKFGERTGFEKEGRLDIDIGARGSPAFARNGVGIEDRPDGASAVVSIAEAASAALRKLLGPYVMFLALR